ncbi:MAG: lamin tail domain-containing protein [bacterium]|nr:lamin tail domain-containing protein [bacterium]
MHVIVFIFFCFFFGTPISVYAADVDIVISEIAAYEQSDHEWVEIFNKGSSPVDLSDWKFFEDATHHNLTAFRGDLIIEPGEYAIIADVALNTSAEYPAYIGTLIDSSWQTLNEGGELIGLKNKEGVLVESFTYLPAQNYSLERMDVTLAEYTSSNWKEHLSGNSIGSATTTALPIPSSPPIVQESQPIIVSSPTKKSSNIISEPNDQKSISSKNVAITEIFPNPEKGEEFIELHNAGSSAIDIQGWELVGGSGRRYEFVQRIIGPGEYLVVFRKESGIALKNSEGDSVKLYPKGYERPSSSVAYNDDAPRGKSFSLGSNGRFMWTTVPTPALPNTILTENKPPVIVVYSPESAQKDQDVFFDGSDSSDPDGDVLTYEWDFGDGMKDSSAQVTHQFKGDGEYSIKASITDGSHQEVFIHRIRISSTPSASLKTSLDTTALVVLNEIFPNPKGVDTREFIEVRNVSDHPVDMKGWSLRDEKSGTSFTFSTSTVLAQEGIFLLERKVSGMTLGNTTGHIILFDQNKTLRDGIDYEDAPSGQSLSRTSRGEWVWSSKPSPGKENDVDSFAEEDDSVMYETDSDTTETPNDGTKKSQEKHVVLKGVVSVPPGVFGKKIAYIAPSGIQLYSSKEMPPMRIGDSVQVSGTLQTRVDGLRLSIRKGDSIRVLSHGDPPKATAMTDSDSLEEYQGKLVTVSGEITEIRWPVVTVSKDDEDVVLSIKRGTGLKRANFVKGASLDATGIVQKNNDEYRILPRSLEDIIRTENHVVSDGQEEEIPAHPEKRQKPLMYLSAMLGAVVLVFGGLFVQKKIINR